MKSVINEYQERPYV